MGRYVLVRVLLAIPTLVGVSVVLFVVLHLAPGGPEAMLIGDQFNEEMAAAARRNLGLDRPLPVQYATWLQTLLRGDLGHSFFSGVPVSDVIGQRVAATIQLAAAALAVAVTGGIGLGIVAAVRQRSPVDRLATALALLGVSFPPFWLGIVLIMVFSVNLGWFPSSGIATYGAEGDLGSRLRHLVLPALTLAALQLAVYMRFTRSAMIESLNQDFVRTARAKGLAERAVVLRHALRNSLIPLLTIASFSIKSLVGGAVFVEVVFAWPGLGRLTVDSVFARDYPVVLGLTMLLSAVTIGANVLVDVLYAVVDPRIRYG
jgi:ABC-type dipeptide/oligopeptide/nickel transport system permease component